MSWSINISNTPRAQAEDAIDAAAPSGQDDLATERDQQVFVAKSAAKKLIASPALFSSDEDVFNVSLYGHANPGHAPAGGWTNDTVTITVGRATAPIAASSEPAQPADAGGDTAAADETPKSEPTE